MERLLPPRAVMRLIWKLHRFGWKLSGGRLFTRSGGMETLQLDTTGHKSGQRRTVLLWFLPDEKGWLVVGTNAGADYDPAWVKNLRADPEAEVVVGGTRHLVRARFLAGDEYDSAWQRFKSANQLYAGYEEVRTRPPAIVRLEPVDQS